MAGAEVDKPHGEWNLLEVYTIGQTGVHVANGEVVLVVEETTADGGAPLSSGQIQIQSEAAECYYKQMKIQPITEFPDAIKAVLPPGVL